MSSVIRLGQEAPNFKAETTSGPIEFHSWLGNEWGVLFSHPADFTPVCTTELGTVAKLAPEFKKRGVKVIGLSCDDVKDHHLWVKDIDRTQSCSVQFPIIADADRSIATKYGMLDSAEHDKTNLDKKGIPFTVRNVFVIDPKKKVRLILIYPASCGRNFDEIIRCIDALQLSDKKPITTPANWTVGKKVIIHPSVSNEEAKKMFPNYETVTPYLRMTEL